VAASFLEDYVKVDDLITRMNKEYPDGRLVTKMVDLNDKFVVFKTLFYKDEDAIDPKCTGHGSKTATEQHWLEKAEQKSRGRCLRVLFGSEPTQEEMEGIVPTKHSAAKNAPKTKLEAKVEELVETGIVEDVSTSKTHVINNVKAHAMTIAQNNETNAKNWYAEALSKMNINEKDLNIDNMQSVKNKISDIVTLLQVETDRGE
jgi:hypothetical protein